MKKLVLLTLLLTSPLLATLNIVLPETTAVGGDTLVYPIYAYNANIADSLYGITIWMKFSNNLVRPFRIFPGNLISDWGGGFNFDTTTNSMIIVMYGGTPPNGNGVLFYMYLSVSHVDTNSQVLLLPDSCHTYDQIANPVDFTIDSGRIAILSVGVGESFSKPHLAIESDMVSKELLLKSSNKGFLKYKIYSIDGRLLKYGDIFSHSGTYKIDVSKLKESIYFIRVSNKEKPILSRKFMIFRK